MCSQPTGGGGGGGGGGVKDTDMGHELEQFSECFSISTPIWILNIA